MKRFKFTLKTIYSVTESEEKQQKLRLRQIEERLKELHAGMEKLEDDYVHSKAQCAQKMVQGMPAEELQQYNAYFEALIAAIQLQAEMIVENQKEQERWLAMRVATRRKLKTLDKLRQKQYDAYLQEVKREEDAEIGDLVSYRSAVKG